MSIVALAYFRVFQFYKRLVRLNSRTIDTVVNSRVPIVLRFAGLLISCSRPVYHQSCFLQEYQYTSREQCIVSLTFCSNIDRLIETSVSLVLLFVGISVLQLGLVYRQSYCLWYYRYTIPTFCSTTDTLVKTVRRQSYLLQEVDAELLDLK